MVNHPFKLTVEAQQGQHILASIVAAIPMNMETAGTIDHTTDLMKTRNYLFHLGQALSTH
jgi:hypothetical protein